MVENRSIFSDSIIQLIITIVGFIFQLILFREINQTIEFKTLGFYALIGSIIQILSVFVANPLSIIWHRETNVEIRSIITAFAFLSSFLLGMISVAVSLIFVSDTDLQASIGIYAIGFIIDCLHFEKKWSLERQKKFIKTIGVFTLSNCIGILIGILYILKLKSNLQGLALIYLIQVTMRYFIFKSNIPYIPNKKEFTTLISKGKEYVELISLSFSHRMLLSIDKWLIPIIFNASTLGLYSRITSLIDIPYLLITNAISKYRFVLLNQNSKAYQLTRNLIVLNFALYMAVSFILIKYKHLLFELAGLYEETKTLSLLFDILIYLLMSKVITRELDNYFKAISKLQFGIFIKLLTTIAIISTSALVENIYDFSKIIVLFHSLGAFIYFIIFIVKFKKSQC